MCLVDKPSDIKNYTLSYKLIEFSSCQSAILISTVFTFTSIVYNPVMCLTFLKSQLSIH